MPPAVLSDHDRAQLRKMIEHNGGMEDNTAKIRENKHSGEIRRCIQHIAEFKKQNPTLLKEDKVRFEEEVLREAGFLFFHYMPIYNLVLKQDDLTVLDALLNELELIERGERDQNEGSFMVGKLLKEIYIDTMVRETAATTPEAVEPREEARPISWADFKHGKI